MYTFFRNREPVGIVSGLLSAAAWKLPLIFIFGTFLVLSSVSAAGAAARAPDAAPTEGSDDPPSLRRIFSLCTFSSVRIQETASNLPSLKVDEEADNREADDRWVAHDKLQHLGASFLLTLSSQYVLTQKLHWNHDHGPLIVSSSVATAAGLGKEYYDTRHGGMFSLRDLAADGLGILLASGLILL